MREDEYRTSFLLLNASLFPCSIRRSYLGFSGPNGSAYFTSLLTATAAGMSRAFARGSAICLPQKSPTRQTQLLLSTGEGQSRAPVTTETLTGPTASCAAGGLAARRALRGATTLPGPPSRLAPAPGAAAAAPQPLLAAGTACSSFE